MKYRQILCECKSMEHQITFVYDEDDDTIYMETHLTTYRNFFKRFWVGIKYAFGYKCKFGNFDEIYLGPNEIKEMEEMLDDYKQLRANYDSRTGN